MAFNKCWLILAITLCVIGIGSGDDDHELLSENFYHKTCPKAVETIRKAVIDAVSQEPRMGASLLRLHFHDCFVQGCDASVLLDDTLNFIGEKNSGPNKNSLRGFEVIDSIKSQLESMCPSVVSCADILALAARDAVSALKGPRWEVKLGRRDSTTASLSESNSDLPAPFFNLSSLITAFQKKNFTIQEMVTLSGGHTIGRVRCKFFRDRIYNESNIDPSFAEAMKALCPSAKGDGDDNLSPFDSTTPDTFDNAFYQNLVNQRGLVHSDQQLYANGAGITDSQVFMYSRNFGRFKKDFADAMVKMSLLSPLTGNNGQIRTTCRFVNN
ncbi:cationic peroxidase 1-like [Arachis hypogaea]|uniref:cationic peroxidase 1-like n=1 Tax=Arachis hypogaea TaxID=3818 RepID=UPI000DEC414C|nr:cationic peroxidase 1-like [Arachis hypogaea]QHO36391.1 Cationic peroxidase [Arachis hypogaea]